MAKKLINTSETYLQRSIDARMVALIEKHFKQCESILDMACGSGLYGRYLKSKCTNLIGFDYDAVLCKAALESGFYDEMYCDNVKNLAQHVKPVDEIFCSEFLEHISNAEISSILQTIELVCKERMIITVPNPLSPHFKQDHTHILKYNVYSFLKLLNSSGNFRYKVYPLGFSELNLQKRTFRTLNTVSTKISVLSPTLLYVGNRVSI